MGTRRVNGSRALEQARRVLSSVQRWHAVANELEVEALWLAEQIRAADWRLDRAQSRLAKVAVSDAEMRAHLAAAEELGRLKRRLLLNNAQRRVAAERIKEFTHQLRKTEATWLRDQLS